MRFEKHFGIIYGCKLKRGVISDTEASSLKVSETIMALEVKQIWDSLCFSLGQDIGSASRACPYRERGDKSAHED